MTNWYSENIKTYNRSAVALSEYFRGIGPRTTDIEFALMAAGNPKNPKIVEIGCGDGRDAYEITKRTSNYVGFDPSEEMIKLARQHVPGANFVVADGLNFKYPKVQDVVFAFASILHIEKDDLKAVLDNVAKTLRSGGVFYISSKYAADYSEKIKDDAYGKRMFYLYNADIIANMSKIYFEVVASFNELRGKTKWFELALVKK